MSIPRGDRKDLMQVPSHMNQTDANLRLVRERLCLALPIRPFCPTAPQRSSTCTDTAQVHLVAGSGWLSGAEQRPRMSSCMRVRACVRE